MLIRCKSKAQFLNARERISPNVLVWSRDRDIYTNAPVNIWRFYILTQYYNVINWETTERDQELEGLGVEVLEVV